VAAVRVNERTVLVAPDAVAESMPGENAGDPQPFGAAHQAKLSFAQCLGTVAVAGAEG